jgi:hypothetical protein
VIDEPVPPTPEEAARSRRIVLGFLAFFVIAAIGTTYFGFQVVARVKAAARESDTALRTVAWHLLVTADQTGFPASPEGLDVDPDVERLDGMLAREPDGWPDTRAAAMTGPGEPLPMGLDRALTIVEVSWPPQPDLPPVLSVGGRPSGLVEDGPTIDHVNRWLRAAAARLASES